MLPVTACTIAMTAQTTSAITPAIIASNKITHKINMSKTSGPFLLFLTGSSKILWLGCFFTAVVKRIKL